MNAPHMKSYTIICMFSIYAYIYAPHIILSYMYLVNIDIYVNAPRIKSYLHDYTSVFSNCRYISMFHISSSLA